MLDKSTGVLTECSASFVLFSRTSYAAGYDFYLRCRSLHFLNRITEKRECSEITKTKMRPLT